MLTEFQVNVTVDSVTGLSTAYVLKMEDTDNCWLWIADHEFGPFDTAYDVTRWLTKSLVNERAFRLR